MVPPSAYQPLGQPPRVILDDELVSKDTTNNENEDTAIAPLAGSTPLSMTMGLAALTESKSNKNGDKLNAVVRFSKGTHQSFSLSNPDADQSVFNELMHQSMSFFNSSGKSLSIKNSDVIAQ